MVAGPNPQTYVRREFAATHPRGRGRRASQSERDLPNDYNPPARLGVVYRTVGKYDEALAAYDRALEKAYGPRKIGILRGKSDTYALKGDKEAAKRTLEEAIRYAESLPEGQRSDATILSLKKKLETL